MRQGIRAQQVGCNDPDVQKNRPWFQTRGELGQEVTELWEGGWHSVPTALEGSDLKAPTVNIYRVFHDFRAYLQDAIS
jgi:hypothetical protein